MMLVLAVVAGCDGSNPATVPGTNLDLLALEPPSAVAGSEGLELVVRGAGFTVGARVLWNQAARPTTYVGPTELRATLAAGDLAAAGTAQVRVTLPAPGSETSQLLTFTITPPSVVSVASVEIDPDSLALIEGAVHQLTAVARDAQGQVVEGRAVQWASSAPDVASVDALGQVTAVRTGTAAITAKVDGTSASVAVGVTADLPYDLVFSGWDGVAGSSTRLYRVDLGDPGREAVMIGPDAAAGDPTPSPDGTRIAYVGLVPGLQQRAIYVADFDGTGVRPLVVTDDPTCGQLAWAPDGGRIAFACRMDGTDVDIWVVDATDGSSLVNLTDAHPGNQDGPSWSPRLGDGSYRIAYAQYVGAEPQIWTMKEDGTDPRQVTAGMDMQPAWSPDGSTIAFQRTGAAIFGDIFLVDADGGNERRLTVAPLAGPQWSPSWSPDGRLLAFASTHETYGSGAVVSQIYTVWADGSKLARRTAGTLDKHTPAWRIR